MKKATAFKVLIIATFGLRMFGVCTDFDRLLCTSIFAI